MTNHTPDPDKLRQARDHAKLLKKSESGYMGEELAAMVEVILSLPEPPRPTMAEVEWDDDEHHGAGAETYRDGEVIMIQPDGPDSDRIICYFPNKTYGGAYIDTQFRSSLTPTGRRFKLVPAEWEGNHGPFPDEEAREDADRLVAAYTNGEPEQARTSEIPPAETHETSRSDTPRTPRPQSGEASAPETPDTYEWDGPEPIPQPGPEDAPITGNSPGETLNNRRSGISADPDPQPGEAWRKDRAHNEAARALRDWVDQHDVVIHGATPAMLAGVAVNAVLEEHRRLEPEQQTRTLTTIEDYEDAAIGTVLKGVSPSELGWGSHKTTIVRLAGGWFEPGEKDGHGHRDMAGTPRTVIWEPEAQA